MKIQLIKAHEHGGICLAPGECLHVEGDQAEWLIAVGTAKPCADEPTAKPTQTRLEEKSK